MTWRRPAAHRPLAENCAVRMKRSHSGSGVSFSARPFRFSYNHWLRTGRSGALGNLVG